MEYSLKEPSASISLRISRELWDKINDLADDEGSPDFSSAARSLIEAGLWLFEHKKDFTDPEKSQKLIEEYNSKLLDKAVLDWMEQLSDTQIQGIQSALEMEKEKRI